MGIFRQTSIIATHTDQLIDEAYRLATKEFPQTVVNNKPLSITEAVKAKLHEITVNPNGSVGSPEEVESEPSREGTSYGQALKIAFIINKEENENNPRCQVGFVKATSGSVARIINQKQQINFRVDTNDLVRVTKNQFEQSYKSLCSDKAWKKIEKLFDKYPDVAFYVYDYNKARARRNHTQWAVDTPS